MWLQGIKEDNVGNRMLQVSGNKVLRMCCGSLDVFLTAGSAVTRNLNSGH